MMRDYDPAVGRYVESDPSGLRGGSFSTYGYVAANPATYSDPFGLCKISLEFSRLPLDAYHITVYTSDAQGNSFFVGGPTHRPFENVDPNPQAQDYGNPDPWGRVRANYGRLNSVPKGSKVVVDDGKPCSCYNKSFENTINWVNLSNIPYDPITQNSNSLANTILSNAGANVPQTWTYWTPGYENNLNSYTPNSIFGVK